MLCFKMFRPPRLQCAVEAKLVSMGKVKGLVIGCFGEASTATHELIHHLATSCPGGRATEEQTGSVED